MMQLLPHDAARHVCSLPQLPIHEGENSSRRRLLVLVSQLRFKLGARIRQLST
jgi:hypothetical protein